ncbi:hypothetical protein ACKF11_13805 [Methylobacillus sp. Pita2]|uniref:hypothetical protein n=1 Tax=Methylobacillus sp. Pita2 TaxID=3383245 RepID=UPI0038B54953
MKFSLDDLIKTLDPEKHADLILLLQNSKLEFDSESSPPAFYIHGPQIAPVALVNNANDFQEAISSYFKDSLGIEEFELKAYVDGFNGSFPLSDYLSFVPAEPTISDELVKDDFEEAFDASKIMFGDEQDDVLSPEYSTDTSLEQQPYSFIAPVNPNKDSRPNYDASQFERQEPQPEGESRPLGIADLIYGAASLSKGLITKPIAQGAKLATAGLSNLVQWRKDRPGNYMQETEKLANTIVTNLESFRQDPGYSLIEAEVTARGGWDPEVSLRFESYLNENGGDGESLVHNAHKKLVSQLGELQGMIDKTVELHKDDPDAAGLKIEPLLQRISAAAGKVPFKIENGEVKQTAFQLSEALRERIKLLVQKISNFIGNLANTGAKPTSL